MSALGSSVINKSGKKIVPKAATQRRRPGASTLSQSPARASTERQATSSTPTPTPAVVQISNTLSPPPSSSTVPRVLSTIRSTTEASLQIVIPADSRTTKETVRNADDLPTPLTGLHPTPREADLIGRSTITIDENASTAPPSRAAASDTAQPSAISEASNKQAKSRKAKRAASASEPVAKRRRGGRSQVEIDADDGESRETNSAAGIAVVNRRQPTRRLRSGKAHGSEATAVVETTQDTPADPNSIAVEAGPAQVGPAKKKRKPSVKKGARAKAQSTDADSQALSADAAETAPSEAAQTTSVPEPAPKRRRKRREPTPELAETVEIAPGLVKMADLCRDLRTGKKSKRERELQALDWTAVIRKQTERKARRARGELPAAETVDQMLARAEREQAPARRGLAAPQMRVVNGKIVVDDQSLQVDRHANAAEEAEQMEEIVENELTRRVTSGSWMKRAKKEAWDEEATELFYQGLRMFGTDFQIISRMVPGMSRRHIKNKFIKEERAHPERINQVLTGPKDPMDLAAYSLHTQTEYEEVSHFNAELEREAAAHAANEARMADEAQQAQLQQRAANETIVESIETEGAAGDSSAKENQEKAAVTVAGPAAGGKKPKKPAGRKKKMHSRHGGGEEVEVLGTIEDLLPGGIAASA